jgi:hypothetical protein
MLYFLVSITFNILGWRQQHSIHILQDDLKNIAVVELVRSKLVVDFLSRNF